MTALAVAIGYCVLVFGVICFQVVLIMGVPWGRLTQGGTNAGALPIRGRIAAAVSILILIGFALAILSSAGSWPHWPRWAGWLVVAGQTLIMIANWITPSRAERRLWGPITTIILAVALAVLLLGP